MNASFGRWHRFRPALRLFIAALVALTPIHATAQGEAERLLERSVKELMKVDERGIHPATLTLEKLDSSLFILNATDDSLISVSIDFAGKRAHCASENMRLTKEGTLTTVSPIGPRDFVVLCLPEQGSYPIRVQGVAGRPKPLEAKVNIP